MDVQHLTLNAYYLDEPSAGGPLIAKCISTAI